MAEISRAALFGKLSPLAYRTIESATVFCKLRTNPYVALEHWLHQILESQDSDLHRIVTHFEIDRARLARDLTEALERLPRDGSSTIDLSGPVEEAVERGWVYGSLMFNALQVRTGHLLFAALKTQSLQRHLAGISRQFERIDTRVLGTRFAALLQGSPEAREEALPADPAAPGEASGALAPAPLGKLQALARYTIDLTAQARDGKLDPVLGRHVETRQLIDILMRRRQNNPMLTGEAGVGKTAVVEGLALRIAAGDVPPPLRDVALRVLDVGLLQAGASMKGEFEARLRQVIEEVQTSTQPVVLFIDEAHTLVGAGGPAGTGDAANLLKPALARGTLRTIGATTWAEYKRYIEKDPALTRRFQPVPILEPDEDRAIAMLRGLAAVMEAHHGVVILEEALSAAVTLSHRYIPDRQLPDKAISLLDTVCARVAVGQYATPPALEAARARVAQRVAEAQGCAREAAIGIEAPERAQAIAQALALERADCEALEARWLEARSHCAAIVELRRRLNEPVAGTSAADAREDQARGKGSAIDERDGANVALGAREDWMAELASHEAALARIQGDAPLVAASVNREAVAAVVQDWTGVPVGRMVGNELETLLTLRERLAERVRGQTGALGSIAQRIQTARMGLDNPSRPIGVFLLAGSSGVGKTETAHALADLLCGGEQNLITVNMTEYQEKHTVSTLKGAPPGYVGYGEGGVLTEAVRRRPYSVVLLDEVEKAHPDVHELFYQVFDKGTMEDGEGRQIDFRNTLIVLTTNAGADAVATAGWSDSADEAPASLDAVLHEALLAHFPAALLGRMTAVAYRPLTREALREIARLKLGQVAARLAAQHGIDLTHDDALEDWLAGEGHAVDAGARRIDAEIAKTVLPRIGRALLERRRDGAAVACVRITVSENAVSCAVAQHIVD